MWHLNTDLFASSLLLLLLLLLQVLTIQLRRFDMDWNTFQR